jgi:hypothetical protein
MMALFFQFIMLGGLVAAMAIGYALAIRPRGRLGIQQTGALLLTLLALIGGSAGSILWWFDLPFGFAWDLPPLASRMLAAAGVSFGVLCLFALIRPTFGRLRLVMVCLFIYLAPLAAAIILAHLDRFDPTAGITYAFFAIAIGMAVVATGYLLRPVRVLEDTAEDRIPPRLGVKTWLAAVAVLTGLWGLALFLTDQGPSSLVWVWPGDLLSSRLIGVMLLTIAGGSLYSLRRAGLSRLMLAMIVTYSLGLAAAALWSVLLGQPVKPAYVMVFGLVCVVSAVLLAGDLVLRRKTAAARIAV